MIEIRRTKFASDHTAFGSTSLAIHPSQLQSETLGSAEDLGDAMRVDSFRRHKYALRRIIQGKLNTRN